MIPQLATPEAKLWAEEYKNKFGITPSASAGGQKYDLCNFFIKAARRTLEKYGKLDRESLHKVAVEEVETGKLTYGREDGAVVHKLYKYTAETYPTCSLVQNTIFSQSFNTWMVLEASFSLMMLNKLNLSPKCNP